MDTKERELAVPEKPTVKFIPSWKSKKELPPPPPPKAKHNLNASKGQGRKRCVHCGDRTRFRVQVDLESQAVVCKSCDSTIKRKLRDKLMEVT